MYRLLFLEIVISFHYKNSNKNIQKSRWNEIQYGGLIPTY